MKTMKWSAVVLTGLFIAALTAMVAKEPVSADADAPRVDQVGAMSVERAAHQATLLQTGQVLVTGGCAGRGCTSLHASAELYDPDAQAFRSVAPMATARASHAAAPLPGGRVLVAGGWIGRRATASAEIYDPARDEWMEGSKMTEARMSPIAAPLPDGRVLLVGGEVRTGEALASAEIFDPASSTFSAVGPMQTPRSSHVAVPLADGRVLVIGGHRARGEVLSSAELFDPATGEFRPTGSMSTPRHKHGAARLADGRVLVIGGSDERDHQGRYTSTEIYDPAAGTFSEGPPMHWARYKIRDAAVALPSGAVLVAGGAARPELFDPADEVFVAAEGALSGPQQFATATLLPTEEVLVLGGYDERIASSASAWAIHSSR